MAREEVMAIGDNFNDVEMLEFAGTPVVMANAVDGLKITATCRLVIVPVVTDLDYYE